MTDYKSLKAEIKRLAIEYGFQQASISNLDTSNYYPEFEKWIAEQNHGEMDYLARNMDLRKDPAALHPNTCRIISLRYNYLPNNAKFTQVLEDPSLANISRYSLGRDYHKLMRKKLKKLADMIATKCNGVESRVFVDSAPVMETALAEKSGLGWKGKHTLLINEQAGSWFFLGEIFINIPLEIDQPVANQCGQCNSCINLCPTDAIVAPYKVDARKCISYLTIENKGSIPVEYRSKMGNRIYGCDDCQLACPWNRFSSITDDADFSPRNNLDSGSLISLFNWTERDFNTRLEGNPIRRIGYQSWLRNIAIALGNAPFSVDIISALEDKLKCASELVSEHILWAMTQQQKASGKKFQLSSKTTKLIRTINKMLPRDA